MYINSSNPETDGNLYTPDKNLWSCFYWLQFFKSKGALFSPGKRKYTHTQKNQYAIPNSNENA